MSFEPIRFESTIAGEHYGSTVADLEATNLWERFEAEAQVKGKWNAWSGALPSCIWIGKIAAMMVGFIGLGSHGRGVSDREGRESDRKGKVWSMPPRPDATPVILPRRSGPRRS